MQNWTETTRGAWQEWFEERAAILEFEAGYERAEAERKARQWMAQHKAAMRPPEQAELFAGELPARRREVV